MTAALTVKAWMAEGKERFGPDMRKWRFVCPVCGYVAAVEDWRAAGAPDAVAVSCIGRYGEYAKRAREAFGQEGPGPCNYAGGGLFALNPVEVTGVSKAGTLKTVQLFAFEGQETD